MKRHEKPYHCTFPPCSKRFGSKSDWKRHENTQHNQHEMWECDMKKNDAPTEQCPKKCYRRESFKHHLQREHQLDDKSQLEEKFEKCRIEQRCDGKFWCGFCERLYEVTPQSAVHAQTERANHIEDHFAGRNNAAKKEISEWKVADPDLPEIDLLSPAEEEEEEDDEDDDDEDEDDDDGGEDDGEEFSASTELSSSLMAKTQESESPDSAVSKGKRRWVDNDATAHGRQSKRRRNGAEDAN
jgi:sal-like protein